MKFPKPSNYRTGETLFPSESKVFAQRNLKQVIAKRILPHYIHLNNSAKNEDQYQERRKQVEVILRNLSREELEAISESVPTKKGYDGVHIAYALRVLGKIEGRTNNYEDSRVCKLRRSH